MHSVNIFVILAFHTVLFASENHNQLPTSADLFHDFDTNLLHSFSNDFGLYHATSISFSYALIKSGTDWSYWEYMQGHKAIPQAGFVGVTAGGLIPLTVPFIFYFKGKWNEDARLMYTGLALGQAVMTSLLVTSAYKAITGRKPPEEEFATETDYSADFNFGFMRRGIFEGWPSGHTTNAFAMATVMWQMYPENNYVKYSSAAYATFIGLSISTNIHWFSDFVAGALIGYSIGKSIGQSFARLADGRKKEKSRTSFIITPNSLHLTLIF